MGYNMAQSKSQRELIESEMVRLLDELKQLNGVRQALDAQTQVRTVEDYLIDGGVAGRVFISRNRKIGGFGNYLHEGDSYRIMIFFRGSTYPYDKGYARIRQISGSGEGEKIFELRDLLDDKEAPLEGKSAE
jgi:hypothetical protein